MRAYEILTVQIHAMGPHPLTLGANMIEEEPLEIIEIPAKERSNPKLRANRHSVLTPELRIKLENDYLQARIKLLILQREQSRQNIQQIESALTEIAIHYREER